MADVSDGRGTLARGQSLTKCSTHVAKPLDDLVVVVTHGGDERVQHRVALGELEVPLAVLRDGDLDVEQEPSGW